MNEVVTDQDLLEAIGRREQAAMRELYQRHADTIYRFALRTLGNPGDAAEIVNEVLMQVWVQPGAFRGGSQVRTWLLGITHHKAVDALRRGRRHQGNRAPEEAIDLEAEPEAHCPAVAGAMVKDNERLVRHCMATLSQTHRHVVHLTFFEELSYPEIARVLEIPTGTVKSRMMHARTLLMGCLQRVIRGNWAPG